MAIFMASSLADAVALSAILYTLVETKAIRLNNILHAFSIAFSIFIHFSEFFNHIPK